MRATTQQNDKRRGSAMILVVVVTVLLAVVGVMFVMVARIGEMETSAVIDSSDLDTAIDSVVEHIDTVLVEDLFGTGSTMGANGPLYNQPGHNPWLASLETNIGVDGFGVPVYFWPRITDLYNNNFGIPLLPVYYDPQHDLNDSKEWDGSKPELKVDAEDVIVKIIRDADRTYVIEQGAANWSIQYAGARADADGDGVADSRWVKVPNLTTSRGKPIFAAVRIIDNCAMLNLNTAYCFYQTPYDATTPISPFKKFWYLNQTAHTNGIAYLGTAFSSTTPYGEGGRYLTEINYLSFLRGSDLGVLWGDGDGWYNIAIAKKFSWLNASSQPVSITPQQAHNAMMTIENSTLHPTILPETYFTFFDIGDELEIRNRFLLTSKAEARFEQKTVANYTLDSGSTDYAALKVPREDKLEDGIPHIDRWKWRVDPKNFDLWSGGDPALAYRYDRRHVSTFYSFDRPLMLGRYASLETALAAETNVIQRQARESVFRPLANRPVDIRTITNPLEMDGVTVNAGCITSNTWKARKNILHLLYALRAYYMEEGLTQAAAAKKSAQIVANLIDYLDEDTTAETGPFGSPAYGAQKNANPTYINRTFIQRLISEISTKVPNAGSINIGAGAPTTPANPYEFGLGMTNASETVYGLERQPFISEIYCFRPATGPTAGQIEAFGLELINPHRQAISLQGWRISIGTQNYDLDGAYSVPAATGDQPNQFGRLTIWAADTGYTVPYTGQNVSRAGFGLGTQFNNTILTLHRPDPANAGQYIAVDKTSQNQSWSIFNGYDIRVSKRDDTGWKFANNRAYALIDSVATLGQANNVTSVRKGYQLPIANSGGPIYTLGDFVKVAFVSNEKDTTTSKTITEHIADARDESDIRYDVKCDPELLDYICFLNRPEKGSLPGRININTAATYVIAAAIPPQLVMTATGTENALNMAEQIVANRPYERVSDLLKIAAFKKFEAEDPATVGDTGIAGDFEKRDWILSRLSNIFTVRSDVFTAYLLVRLGEDGPERRMIAIFDRSQCWTPSDRPRLVALHPVPDPR